MEQVQILNTRGGKTEMPVSGRLCESRIFWEGKNSGGTWTGHPSQRRPLCLSRGEDCGECEWTAKLAS